MKNNISKENSDNNLRELSSELIELKKAYKKLQDSFVKTPVENKDTKKDEVVVSKTEENKIDLKVLCRQLEESREYCKEQFLHLYITKERYDDHMFDKDIKDKYPRVFYWFYMISWASLPSNKEEVSIADLCDSVSDGLDMDNPSHFVVSSSEKKQKTLGWLIDGTINKKNISLFGNLITSEDLTDCKKISKIPDSLFFVHNTRADELTKHIKDTIEYLKKISQVVKILDKFLGLKYSDRHSTSELAETFDVIAIKILDDDGRLTKEAIEKADSLKKQLHL